MTDRPVTGWKREPIDDGFHAYSDEDFEDAIHAALEKPPDQLQSDEALVGYAEGIWAIIHELDDA